MTDTPFVTRWLPRRKFPAILQRTRFNRNEIAGSLGDLGTFLPLLTGMAIHNGLNFTTALFFAGVFNIITGLTFAVPMAVQPMKAIAAVALTEGLTAPQIVAAGAMVSLVILVLGLTGLVGKLQRVIPTSVIRGLQLALGVALTLKGLQMVLGTGRWLAPDSYLTGLLTVLAVVALWRTRKVPVALLLFFAGLLLAVWKMPAAVGLIGMTWSLPSWGPPAWHDFATALPKAALPQIPLTLLNSVIAVCALATQLFPQERISPRHVAVSVGLMNLTGMWFGAMPMCHGAGGLAGQYRFGARTNGSILFLGAAKIVIAVMCGSTIMMLFHAFPASILGVMLAVSGLELASVVRDQRHPWALAIAGITAAVCLGSGNIVGLLTGIIVAYCVARWLPQPEASCPLTPKASDTPSPGAQL